MEIPSGPDRPTRRRLLAASVTGGATLAGCLGVFRPHVAEVSFRTFAVPSDLVSVENPNGSVEVEPHEGEGVVVEIRKRGPSQVAIDAVVVDGEPEDGGLVVRTGNRSRNVTVDLTVGMPASGRVGWIEGVDGAVVRGVSGDAQVRSGSGTARALDVDGYVDLWSGRGIAIARGTNGLSEASAHGDALVEVHALREDAQREGAEVDSYNGDVEVGVAPDLDAEVVATAGDGDLDIDVELVDASVTDERASGRLGDGGPRLTLTAGNGGVRLYELPE